MYLIDSDTLISLGRGNTSVQDRMNRAGLTKCAISEISLAELYVGVYKGDKKRLEPILSFLEETLPIVPISSAVKTYARTRARLESEGIGLKDMDLFIAATALANGYTLVTHNVRHFSRIPGLKIADWITP
jgi:predicted nucleic acid-binding protein